MPPYAVRIELASQGGGMRSYPLRRSEIRLWVEEWCKDNCTTVYHIGKVRTIHFESEADAFLFMMAHHG